MSSCEVVTRMDEHRVAIRFGHFYSPRLLNLLGLDADEGVIRVSMVHYNTLAEVDRLTTAGWTRSSRAPKSPGVPILGALRSRNR